MGASSRETSPPLALKDWDSPLEPVRPLPGQVELFEYRPYLPADGQGELFDTGRDLPGAEEEGQRLIWDLEA